MKTISANTSGSAKRLYSGWIMLDEINVQQQNQLMLAARNNPEAFEALYKYYARPIYRFIRRRTGTREEAEDLTSQVFIRVWERLHLYRGGIVSAWLFRIAHNTVVSYYRRRQYLLVSVDDREIADDTQEIHPQIEASETRQMISRLLEGLSDENLSIVTMAMYQGLTSYDIGERLKMSPITVRTRLHRMMKELRTAYIAMTGSVWSYP
jgi:RNA polymerase sigma-70 factor, ECF subfamily